MYENIRSRIVLTLRSRTIRLLLVIGLVGGILVGTLLAFDLWDVVLAAPPIDGNPISVEGPTTASSVPHDIIQAVIVADIDGNSYPDIAFGQAHSLTIKANTGATTTQWMPGLTIGSATYDIRGVDAVDLDRDGAIDLISASADDSGNSQLRLWRNPTLPFTNSWATYNTLTTSAISLTSIASADLDRNGTPDLVSGGLDGVLRLWSNPLTGAQPFATSWPSPAAIATTDRIRRILIADIDRDGM
ncbi:MAG: VCBS repeat-containing protein, partial [Chloroflexi bacterium]|nr:VCBS repeat-containing protein [Chloroflexota bacterium]